MSRELRIAVLGAGIMGCSTALYLARAGCDVWLFDQAPVPMDRASRWNEGKIHLGFLYAADSTMRSAERIIPGGLAFKKLVEELTGASISSAATTQDEIYLVHPDSIVDADTMHRYFLGVQYLIERMEGEGSYLAPISRVERLSNKVVGSLASGSVRAGFRVPERSIRTDWVADRFVDALAAEPRTRLLTGTTVLGVNPSEGSWEGPWKIRSDPAVQEEFDVVVNALWQGRLAVDLTAGIEPEPGWSHRFRLSLFVQTLESLNLPSAVLATGPFGDVKNYSGRQFYLSWYPAGLLMDSRAVVPPENVAMPSPNAFTGAVKEGLTTMLPSIGGIFDRARNITMAGGWVFALGEGSLADSSSSLHRRDRFGVKRIGNYISVDTGKYSTAPWLARRLADAIMGI